MTNKKVDRTSIYLDTGTVGTPLPKFIVSDIFGYSEIHHGSLTLPFKFPFLDLNCDDAFYGGTGNCYSPITDELPNTLLHMFRVAAPHGIFTVDAETAPLSNYICAPFRDRHSEYTPLSNSSTSGTCNTENEFIRYIVFPLPVPPAPTPAPTNGCTGTGNLFVVNFNLNIGSVSVINATTLTVIANITVGLNPVGVAVSPDGAFAYVTNFGSNIVSVINTITLTVVANIAVGMSPWGVAISHDGAFAYVANFDSDSVSIINTTTQIVIKNISVGSHPQGVAIGYNGIYVTNSGGNTVSVIDTTNQTVTDTIMVGLNPSAAAVSTDGAFVYVLNSADGNVAGTVSVISTAFGNVTTPAIAVGLVPTGVAVSPDGTVVYVANFGSDTVSVITTHDDNVLTTQFGNGTKPWGVAISHDGAFAYVANVDSDSVSIINTVTGNVSTPDQVGLTAPTAVAVCPGPPPAPPPPTPAPTPCVPFVYATSFADNRVLVLSMDLETIIANISVGINPSKIAITRNGLFAYVCTQKAINVISTRSYTVIHNISLDDDVTGISISYDDAVVYVILGQSIGSIDVTTNQISIMNRGSGSDARDPTFIAVDNNGTYIYVAMATGAGDTSGTILQCSTISNMCSGSFIETLPDFYQIRFMTILVAPSGIVYATGYTDQEPTMAICRFYPDFTTFFCVKLTVGLTPKSTAISYTNIIYSVLVDGDRCIAVIEAESLGFRQCFRLPQGLFPTQIAITADGAYLYVATNTNNVITSSVSDLSASAINIIGTGIINYIAILSCPPAPPSP